MPQNPVSIAVRAWWKTKGRREKERRRPVRKFCGCTEGRGNVSRVERARVAARDGTMPFEFVSSSRRENRSKTGPRCRGKDRASVLVRFGLSSVSRARPLSSSPPSLSQQPRFSFPPATVRGSSSPVLSIASLSCSLLVIRVQSSPRRTS